MRRNALILTLLLVFSTSVGIAPTQAKPKCTKTEIKTYETAKYQMKLYNTLIQISLDIKKLVDEKYAGTLRDYQPQDIYNLQKADSDLEKDRASRAKWESSLSKMAKKCGFKMTSRSELLPAYYEE